MKGRAFGLPGGRVERNEHPFKAAKRELLEGIGLASDKWKLLKIWKPASGKIRWLIYIYIAKNRNKVAEQELDAGERIDLVAVTFDGF